MAVSRLCGISEYNPAILSDDELVEQFTARQREYNAILQHIRDLKPKKAASAVLLVGQRGMGKTTLLRRLAVMLARDEKLEKIWLPLSFPEEQYNIGNLRDFWLNCLDALGDCMEKREDLSSAQKIDDAIDAANDKDAEEVRLLLFAFAKKLKKRFVLFLDNVDLIFDRLGKPEAGQLRQILKARTEILIVAATTNLPTAKDKLFHKEHIYSMTSLRDEEVREMLLNMADQRDEPQVREIIEQGDRGRIKVLNHLAGGNPRTIVQLYTVLQQGLGHDINADLDALLDRVTPLYKARFEELPPLAQRVLDALALHWYPIQAGPLAGAMGLEVNNVSTQLNRLIQAGWVKKHDQIELARTGTPFWKEEGGPQSAASKRHAFEVAERFFNIWYLMRASRRDRRRMLALVRFLQMIMAKEEVDHFIEKSRDKALKATYAKEQRDMAQSGTMSAADGAHSLDNIADFRRRFRQDGDTVFQFLATGKVRDKYDVDGWAKQAMKTGKAWLAAVPGYWQVIKAKPMTESEAKKCAASFKQLIHDHPQKAWLQTGFGILLANKLERYEEAKAAYRRAIELDPDDAAAWNNLGALLGDKLERYEEAEAAYRRAIELDPDYAVAWYNLGILLANKLERYEEAKAAYRRAIELDPDDAGAWNNLGALLGDKLDRYEEAEAAYRRAIELDPDYAAAWNNLGILLADKLDRYEEAEAAYRRAIEIDPDDGRAHDNFTLLLFENIHRLFEEASQTEPSELAAQIKTELAKFPMPDPNGIILNHLILPIFHEIAKKLGGQQALELAHVLPEFSRRAQLITDLEVWSEVERVTGKIEKGDWIDSAPQIRDLLKKLKDEPKLFSFDALVTMMRISVRKERAREMLELLDSSGAGKSWEPLREAVHAVVQGSRRHINGLPAEMRDSAADLLKKIAPDLKD